MNSCELMNIHYGFLIIIIQMKELISCVHIREYRDREDIEDINNILEAYLMQVYLNSSLLKYL